MPDKNYTYFSMSDKILLIEKEELRDFAFANGKILDYEMNQRKSLRKIMKDLTFTHSERQKRYENNKKMSGLKQIRLWVKDNPKYKFAGTDIHAENIGICQKDQNINQLMETYMQFLINKNVPSALIEDIASLLKIFGLEGTTNDG